jgi:spore maturation protein CgeB
VGSYSKRRENIIGNISSEFPVEIWGAGWGLSSLRTKKNIHIHNQVMKQADFPEMISKSLVNLNMLTIENSDITNLKVFEITACFGLLLTDYNAYTESFLKNGSLYYSPENMDELNERLAYIFDSQNNDSIQQIKESGYLTITNSNNTINDRVDVVLDIIAKEIA